MLRKLTKISRSRDLEGEICQTFHIVPNERTNERAEFARKGVGAISPFSASKGEMRANPRRTAGCLFNSK